MIMLAQPLLLHRVAGRRRRTRVVRSTKGRWLVRPRRPPTAAVTRGLDHNPTEPAKEDGSEPYSLDHQPRHRNPEAASWPSPKDENQPAAKGGAGCGHSSVRRRSGEGLRASRVPIAAWGAVR